MEWFDLLCGALGREDLAPGISRLPFSVAGETEIAWGEPRLERGGAAEWQLSVGSPQGIEATWRVREHADTRALECSGSVRNAGRSAVAGIRQLRTLDLSVGLHEGWGRPVVRTIGGAARSQASFYPPDDFRSQDRRLLPLQEPMMPVSIAARENGDSSADALPLAILAGERGDRGLALFYEWSGLWSVAFQQGGWSDWPWALRASAGVWGLDIDLRPGEELPLPNLLVVGFDGDLEAGGNALRRHLDRHVAPPLGDERPLPPVSYNPWFAFGNAGTAELLKPVVRTCAELGVEYFCIDASWVSGGFRQGIGNWRRGASEAFPDGMSAFNAWVGELGLKPGLYFEMEYAHVDSEVHRAHPEWFLPGPRISPWSKPLEWRYDFVQKDPGTWDFFAQFDPESEMDLGGDMFGSRFALFDLGQAEARQWCIETMVEAYERWGVRWVRWDFNQSPRPHWDLGVEPGRVGINQINHVTGFYAVLDEIRRACPELFVEQCATGGMRIDLGTVRRGHSYWMNDQTHNTDAVRALQHGLNTVLPGIYANTNLAEPRFDFDDYDFLSHGGGPFGLSGLLSEAPRADLERYREAIDRFKGYRHLLGGDYSRPTGNPAQPSEPAQVAWTDGSETLEMDFNVAGPRSAEIRQSGA